MNRSDRAEELFRQGYNCCQSVFAAFADTIGMTAGEAAKIASPFGAGFGKMREVCGAVSGMTLLAGYLTGYSDPSDYESKKELYALIQKMCREFENKEGSLICRDLLCLKKGEDTAEPSVRTEEYYQSRPCIGACRAAAEIAERYLQSMMTVSAALRNSSDPADCEMVEKSMSSSETADDDEMTVSCSVSDDRNNDAVTADDSTAYEEKREREVLRVSEENPAAARPPVKVSEYTVDEIRTLLTEMSGKYDLARVVDPIECRILEFSEDGRVSMNESCYGIWNSGQKCINCSSAKACRTGCHQEKAEKFQDKTYFIQSNPVKLKLEDGGMYDAVMELVNVEAENDRDANDREAENIGGRASHYMAHHDSLTNVLNADTFYELARGMIKNSPEISWVMVTGNIMNFRLINTLFGDQKGNEVLVKTASVLHEISEHAGGLCGRLGGDHFALLIRQSAFDEDSILNAAALLEQSFNSGMYTFCIHFGVYMIDDPSIPVSVMCGRANSALRTIREDMSRVIAYFDDAILQQILLEQKVIGSFEEALNDGQFRMYLQPMVDSDGKVLGAEALARWISHDGTVVMPGDFIPTLEKAGLIHKLDMHIWELAVRQLSEWQGTDKKDLNISVNMSARDFYSIDVYEVLTQLIEKYNVPSSMLRLEITETALLVEPEKSNSVVSKLRQKGFLVEIDDFGSGYSSLSLLKNIHADVLKIDMSFLREIRDRKRSRTILNSVICLAKSLGMEVITEGIETENQLRALSEMGCSHFQGFYFSRPIPVVEFENYVTSPAASTKTEH